MIFSQILNDINEAVILTDFNFIIKFFNNSCNLFFTDDEIVCDKNITEILFDEDCDIRDMVLEHVSNFGEWKGKLNYFKKSGKNFEIDAIVKSIELPKDNFEGFIWILKSNLDIEKMKQEYLRTEKRLRELTVYLQSIREEERATIARKVHDDLGQVLTTLKMDLHSISEISESKVTNRLIRSISLVDDAINTVRRISTELRPPILDHLGLVSAIDWQIEEFSNRTSIKCSQSLQKDVKLGKNISIALFRVFQEILTNITRHSKATSVNVEMFVEDSYLIFNVEDNGIGIKEDELNKFTSLGIFGMQERISLLNGTMNIETNQNEGTKINIKIPFTENGADQ